MARPYSPWDVSVGNDRLPLLQMIAQNDRRVRGALAAQPPMPQAAMTQAPMTTPPAETQPIRLGPMPTAQRQAAPQQATPQQAITRRAQTPIAPEMRQQAAASQPGVAGIMAGLSPQERQMMLASMLAGASGGLSNMLAARPNAGIGEMLLAVGSGGLGGQVQGHQGIRLGRQQDMRGRLLERQVASQEAKLAQEQEKAARLQSLVADMPPEMQRVVAMSQAGVPAAGIEAMVPQRLTPYQEASLRLREQEIARSGAMTPYQSEMLALRRQELERSPSSKPQIFGSGGAGYYTLGPDGKPQQLVAPQPGSAEGGTALMKNVPYVAKAMGIPEKDATELLLQSASGRKSPEQIKADFAKTYMQNSFGATPEESVRAGEELYNRIYGGQPAPTPEAEAESGSTFSIFDPSTWLPGGGDANAPVEAAPAQAQQQPAATGTELPMLGDGRRPDPSKLQSGTAYTLPNGEVAVWDGQQFVVE